MDQGHPRRDNQYVPATVTIRGKFNIGINIRDRLQLVPSQLQLFRSTCFGPWLDFVDRNNYKDPLLVHLFLQTLETPEVPSDEELVFSVGGVHVVRFTREDFCIITGMRFGVGTFPSTGDVTFQRRVFPTLDAHTSHVKASHVYALFADTTRFGRLSDADAVRVCLLMMLHLGFMGLQDDIAIHTGILCLVEDFESWNSYPWGSFLWSQTHRCLSTALKKRKSILEERKGKSASCKDKKDIWKYNIAGFIFAFRLRSFVETCSPIIVIDGAHLKGRYQGTMFVAVGMDGNTNILPIAYGVGATESGQGWTWFLSKLRECLGHLDNLVFISDRASLIDLAIRTVYPDALHGLCCRHLCMNLRIKSQANEDNEYHFWNTCKSYRKSDFLEAFRKLRLILPVKSRKIIDNLDKEKWSRAFFPGDRYNLLTSNSAESLNSMTRHARKLPICMLLEFMRATTQRWYHERRKIAEDLDQPLTPWATEKLDGRIKRGSGWKAIPINDYMFEVKDNKKGAVVSIRDKKCSCQVWQKSGIPCSHLVAALYSLKRDHDVAAWAQHWFKAENYKRTYTGSIFPVGHPSEWLRQDKIPTIKPPSMERRQAGRPKNKDRILSQGERKQVTCDRCKKKGHTRKICSAKIPEYQCSSQPSSSRSTKAASTSRRKKKPTNSSQASVDNLYDD